MSSSGGVRLNCILQNLFSHLTIFTRPNYRIWPYLGTYLSVPNIMISGVAHRFIPTMTNSHNGGNLSRLMIVGIYQWQIPPLINNLTQFKALSSILYYKKV